MEVREVPNCTYPAPRSAPDRTRKTRPAPLLAEREREVGLGFGGCWDLALGMTLICLLRRLALSCLCGSPALLARVTNHASPSRRVSCEIV